MRLNLFHINPLSVLSGTLAVTAVVMSHADLVAAKSRKEIFQVARQITVQINGSNKGGGSGVIIAKQGNTYTVVTADHVVNETDLSYTVRTYEGKEYPASIQRLQKRKNNLDLAVVKFNASKDYPRATIGNSDYIDTTAEIYVYGYPRSIEKSGNERMSDFVLGFITRRDDSASEGYSLRYSAPTWKGMSGGPVFDVYGRVVGIHGKAEDVGFVKTSASKEELIKTGFNSAIPINTFMGLLSQVGLSCSQLAIDTIPIDSQQTSVNNSYVQGLSRYDAGDKQGAVAAYNQAIRSNPNYGEAYFYRGVAKYDLREPQQAIADYTQAVRLNPELALAFYNRGLARFEQGDTQGAIEDYTQAIQIAPSFAAAYNNRGRIRSDLRDQEGAIADFTNALRIESKRPNTYYNRGLARFRLMDDKGAIADYTQAIRLYPNYAKAYGNRGIAHERLGNKKAAILDLQKAAELFRSEGKMTDYQRAIDRIQKLQQR